MLKPFIETIGTSGLVSGKNLRIPWFRTSFYHMLLYLPGTYYSGHDDGCFNMFHHFTLEMDVIPATRSSDSGLRRFPRRLDQWAHLGTILPAMPSEDQQRNDTENSRKGTQNPKICRSDDVYGCNMYTTNLIPYTKSEMCHGQNMACGKYIRYSHPSHNINIPTN